MKNLRKFQLLLEDSLVDLEEDLEIQEKLIYVVRSQPARSGRKSVITERERI